MPLLMNEGRIRREMEKHGLDAIVASTPQNVQYVSDILSDVGCVVLPMEKNLDPFIVTWVGYADKIADSDTWVKDTKYAGTFFYENSSGGRTDLEHRIGKQFQRAEKDLERRYKSRDVAPDGPSLVEKVIEGLTERNLDKATVGLEESGTTVRGFELLERKLPKAKLQFADGIFTYSRMVKTQYELELFKIGTPMVERGIEAACKIAREGVSEQELVNECKKSVVSEGAGVGFNPILAVGYRSVMPSNGVGMDRSTRLEKGEMIRFNPTIFYKDHPFHMGRTVVLGEPREPRLRPYYKAILAGSDAELASIKPGVKASEIFSICENAVKSAGISQFRRHHVGHSLGLGPPSGGYKISGCDQPTFSFDDNTPIEEGMVFNLEPNYYEIGLGGLHLEDTISVTKTGCTLLTTSSRELRII